MEVAGLHGDDEQLRNVSQKTPEATRENNQCERIAELDVHSHGKCGELDWFKEARDPLLLFGRTW